jgi:hypothetical protein
MRNPNGLKKVDTAAGEQRQAGMMLNGCPAETQLHEALEKKRCF